MAKALLLALALAALLLAAPAAARQLAHARTQEGEQVRFDYRYEGHDRRPHAVSFRLPAASVRSALQAFKPFDAKALRSAQNAAQMQVLRDEVATLRQRFPDATLRLQESDGGWGITYAIDVKGAAQESFRQALDIVREEARAVEREHPGIRVSVGDAGDVRWQGRADAEAQRRIDQRMRDAVRRAEAQHKRDSAGAQSEARQQKGAIAGALDRAVAEARRRGEERRADYLAERRYTTMGGKVILPDYARMAREGVADLAPSLPDWKRHLDGLDARQRIGRLLAFFQAIPYDQLQDARTSNAAGFAVPAAMLQLNRGDCDTKAVAFASLLRLVDPQVPIVMVLLDRHALLGLGIPAAKGERTIAWQGRSYVLVEPVGPALSAIGEIGPETRRQIGGRKDVIALF
ncbi:MAG: hypothetical protein JNK11_00605 [Alphaproteobacteria bacterium]|nr:hypothetical protein [Alphaproteobacteria bacterium]